MEGLVQLSLNPCRGGPRALSAAPWGGLWMSTLGQTQDLDLSFSFSPERVNPSVLFPQPLWLPPLEVLGSSFRPLVIPPSSC